MALDYGDFEKVDSSVIYNAWCPSRFTHKLERALEKATRRSGSPVPIRVEKHSVDELVAENNKLPIDDRKEIVPPTFIEKNDFSAGFQMLNDAYGIPNYDELNGGAFYCMYPFLFGVMFGDIGHSIFYILAGIALLALDPVAKKNKWDLGEMGSSVFRFKWLVFFASICSLYCGFVYNEFFGLPLSMVRSHWKEDFDQSGVSLGTWSKTDNSIYPFGIDPTWFFKDNELIFLNSFKMKLSVVMGMCQMVFGMFLQFINHCYRKDVRELLVKWLPEMMYLVPFFGYLVVIILKKWLTDFHDPFYPAEQQENGVNLIQMMIGMILSFGSKDMTLQLYENQWNVQKIVTILFFVSIPYLLFAKPICECIRLRGTAQFNVLEIFVMNLIGVIEFCLGALSHTASYLRLWALSLAHSQLSHVVYDELFEMELKQGNVGLMWIAFAGFCALTAAILLGMEAFSALLHAIRLMWVEFSSKFYTGMGVAFRPLSLQKHFKAIGVI